MYLKRIRVRNWKAIVDTTVDLEPGLNIICGPNESGKSSIREALRCAFMTASRPRGKSPVAAARPWGKSRTVNPHVEIEFWHDEQLWRLKKVFFADGSELERAGKIIARNDDVQKQLDLHLADLAVLWATQGEIHLTEVPTPLRPQLAATEAVTPGISSLEIELNQLYDKHWTAAREGARKPMREAVRRTTEAHEQLEKIKDELRQVDDASETILDLDRQLESLKARESTLASERKQAQQQLDAWTAHQRVEAECQALDRDADNLQGWIDKWNRNVEELRAIRNKVHAFEEQLTASREKLGKPADRSAVQKLNARLLYARALLQRRLREEIERCQAPMPEQMHSLDAVIKRVDWVGAAMRRLEELDVDAQQLTAFQQELEDLKAQHAEIAASAQQANKNHRAAEEQGKDACSKVQQQITNLEHAREKWTGLRQRLLELVSDVDEYEAKIAATPGQSRHAPSREPIDALKAQMAYGKARYQALISAELDELKTPTREQLVQLDGLTKHADALEKVAAQFEPLSAASEELRVLNAELAAIEQQHTAASEEAGRERRRIDDLARQADERSHAAAQQGSELTRGREQWIRLRNELATLLERLENYQQRLEACRARLGPEPDFGAVESARKRLEYGRTKYQAMLRQELRTLKPSAPEELSRLEDAERELRSLHQLGAATASRFKAALMLGIGISIGVLAAVPGIVLQWPPSQTALVAVGAAALAVLVFWLMSRSRIGRPAARVAELENVCADLKKKLAVDSLDQARERLKRAEQLKLRIEGELPLQSALAELRKNCPDPDSLDTLSVDALGAEVKNLGNDLGLRQSEWEEATKKYSTGRSEWEMLLQDNPERQVDLVLNHLKGLGSDFPELHLELPASSELAALRALDMNAVTAWFDERLSRLETDAASQPFPEAPVELSVLERKITDTRTALETARAGRDELSGRVKSQREILQQKLNEVPEPPGAVADDDVRAWLSVQSHKIHAGRQAILNQVGMTSLEEARQRYEAAEALRSQLDGSPSGPLSLSDLRVACLDAGRIDRLSRTALQQELERLPLELETEEREWRKAHHAWEANRETYEKMLKEDPRGLLPEKMTQFRNLAREYEELQLDVPQECDGAWIEFVRANSVDERIKHRIENLLNGRAARLANLVPAEVVRRLQDANTAMAESQAKVEASAQKRNEQSGTFQGHRADHNRLLRSNGRSVDLEEIELPQQVHPQLEKARAFYATAQDRHQEVLKELRVPSLEDAQSRVERARLLEAQLENVTSDLAILRVECVDPEQLEKLSTDQLQAEIRTLPDRLDRATKQSNLEQEAYEQRRDDHEKLLKENPQRLLEGNLRQFRLLTEERPAFGLSVPEAWNKDWQELVEQGNLLEPARQNLSAQRTEIARRRAAAAAPPVPFEQVQQRFAELENEIKRIAGEKESKNADIMLKQGSIKDKADLFYRRALAEENYEKARLGQHEVQLEADAIKLLWSSLVAAKKELENDLVGPLRQRINRRLAEITSGRYSGIKLEQDFQAEMLLTAGRSEAPLEHLSFGTREQVAFLSRLCLAELLSEKERHLVVFDDNLVHTDTERMESACRILQEVARTAQILLLTCHPERFEGLPAELRRELPVQP